MVAVVVSLIPPKELDAAQRTAISNSPARLLEQRKDASDILPVNTQINCQPAADFAASPRLRSILRDILRSDASWGEEVYRSSWGAPELLGGCVNLIGQGYFRHESDEAIDGNSVTREPDRRYGTEIDLRDGRRRN